MLCGESGRVVVSVEDPPLERCDETVFVRERVRVVPGGLFECSLTNSDSACREGSPEDLLNQSGTVVDLSLGCFEWP